MAKHSVTITTEKRMLFVLLIVLLALGFVYAAAKYFRAQQRWYAYTNQAQQVIMQYPQFSAQEDGKIISTTITTVPAGYSLWKDQVQMQVYIASLSKQLGRVIVVMDAKKMILADTLKEHVGTTYASDKGNEIMQVLTSGQAQSFEEKSNAYPSGITFVAVPVKDIHDGTIGAVLVSASYITQ